MSCGRRKPRKAVSRSKRPGGFPARASSDLSESENARDVLVFSRFRTGKALHIFPENALTCGNNGEFALTFPVQAKGQQDKDLLAEQASKSEPLSEARSLFLVTLQRMTNGQAERMNRTIKEATVRIFHYETLESLSAHVLAFITAYNFAKHLKALRWRTPFQAICDAWTRDPAPFKINPYHLIPGPHT